MSKSMTLEDFAAKAGVTVVRCDKEWGGTYAYKEADYPQSTICGFRSERAAINGWFESTFGKQTAKALRQLLAPSKPRVLSKAGGQPSCLREGEA